MSVKNLWGDLSELERVVTPKEILLEQASLLTEATKGVLVGQVSNNSIYGKFAYDLEVSVPALNNYTYTILTIQHQIELYPVRIITNGFVLSTECGSEKEFISALTDILSSKEVKFVLSRLLSQAS